VQPLGGPRDTSFRQQCFKRHEEIQINPTKIVHDYAAY
jgi:hypothetical protein